MVHVLLTSTTCDKTIIGHRKDCEVSKLNKVRAGSHYNIVLVQKPLQNLPEADSLTQLSLCLSQPSVSCVACRDEINCALLRETGKVWH